MASASSNADMIENAVIDIWIHSGVGPVTKYEDDCNVFCFPVPDGPLVYGEFRYAYDKLEAEHHICNGFAIPLSRSSVLSS